jgi:rRNA processing protein Krr1/Pno1
VYVRIKLLVMIFDTSHSVTDSTQSVAASLQKLRYSVFKLVRRARHKHSRCVRRKNRIIGQFEVSRFVIIKFYCKIYPIWILNLF